MGDPGDNDYDTWEDWCDSDIQDRYCGFPPDDEDPQSPVIICAPVFRGKTWMSWLPTPFGGTKLLCTRGGGGGGLSEFLVLPLDSTDPSGEMGFIDGGGADHLPPGPSDHDFRWEEV